jgi:hypothetical protein
MKLETRPTCKCPSYSPLRSRHYSAHHNPGPYAHAYILATYNLYAAMYEVDDNVGVVALGFDPHYNCGRNRAPYYFSETHVVEQGCIGNQRIIAKSYSKLNANKSNAKINCLCQCATPGNAGPRPFHVDFECCGWPEESGTVKRRLFLGQIHKLSTNHPLFRSYQALYLTKSYPMSHLASGICRNGRLLTIESKVRTNPQSTSRPQISQ